MQFLQPPKHTLWSDSVVTEHAFGLTKHFEEEAIPKDLRRWAHFTEHDTNIVEVDPQLNLVRV